MIFLLILNVGGAVLNLCYGVTTGSALHLAIGAANVGCAIYTLTEM